mmetsp:Transcript_11498/g.32255  ORF Transcript_11498/g.32255 Transcript_11498/m.32255 type:complete len:727 (+) Transcript_11498:2001-4181(+)
MSLNGCDNIERVTSWWLVDLLHGREASVVGLLELGEVIVAGGVRGIVHRQAEAQGHHPVDPAGELSRLLEREARREHGSLEHQEGQVAQGCVALVSSSAVLELVDDGVLGVHLQRLLGTHVHGHRGVTQGLCLHDPLHVRGPSILSGDEHARGVDNPVRDNDLLHLVAQDVFHHLGELLELGLLLLLRLLLLLGLVELEAFLGDGDKLLAVILLELLDDVLVDRVHQEQDFQTLALQTLQERRVLDGLTGFPGDEVDGALSLLHAGDVVLQAGHLISALRRVIPEKLGELGPVLRILVNAELDILAEGLVELGVVVLVLSQLSEHLDGLLDDVLPDDLKDLVLLKHFPGNVQRQVLRVDNTLEEAHPLGGQLRVVIRDENAAHVQLDAVGLLLRVEDIERRTRRAEQDGLELELTLDGKVLVGDRVLPVVGQGLVEGVVLLPGHLVWTTHPDGLGLVDKVPLVTHLLDGLGLLLVAISIVRDLLDLSLLGLVLLLLLVVANLFLDGLLDPARDRVGDELAVLLDQVLDPALLEVLHLVLLEVQNHLGPATQLLALRIPGNGEGATGLGLPDVLLVVVVLGDHRHLVGHQICGVETNSELADHRDVGASGEGLHEVLRAGAGDGSQVVDQVGLGHSDTRVNDGEGFGRLVRHDVDVELWVGFQDALVREGLVADLVQRITRVGDQLPEENLLVRVERVDDQRQELVDLSLEGVGFTGHFREIDDWFQ